MTKGYTKTIRDALKLFRTVDEKRAYLRGAMRVGKRLLQRSGHRPDDVILQGVLEREYKKLKGKE
jgi:hypothetical protein